MVRVERIELSSQGWKPYILTTVLHPRVDKLYQITLVMYNQIMDFKFKNKVKLWPTSASPWHYVDVPSKIVGEIPEELYDRGLIKCNLKIGDYEWQTSILPAGKDKKIIALKKQVRDDLKIQLGDSVSIHLEISLK